jgi:hypothetical protein
MADSLSLITLKDEIVEAKILFDSTLVSIDGSDICVDDYWTISAVREEFVSAIDEAAAIRDDSSSTDVDYDNAVDDLLVAVVAFNEARQSGTKIEELGSPTNSKDSILTSVKKLLGIQEEDESFDVELILDINSVFMILNQLGLGPVEGFTIEDKEDVWSDFLKNRNYLNAAKSYIYLKVRLMFDPPQMGYLVESINKQCQEFEWRLNAQVETKLHKEEDGQNGSGL